MRLFIGVLWIAAGGAALAQQDPVPLSAWATPNGAARIFVQACVQTNAEEGAAVDWALAHGFEPVDPMRGSMEGLRRDERVAECYLGSFQDAHA